MTLSLAILFRITRKIVWGRTDFQEKTDFQEPKNLVTSKFSVYKLKILYSEKVTIK